AAEPVPLIPKPLINGHDIMALGVPPGKKVGEMLTNVQNLQLEGKLNNREEALAAVKEWIAAG
ncbi:MAG: hypothetical protein K1X50_02060, partial [Candidatus Promineofilum sp.]|nr:hypothetical protein [Promineifilum sp.]